MQSPIVDALIFAGGTGKRMTGSSVPKQFLLLGGRPIIAYTLDHFAKHPQVTGITVVCLESWIDYLREVVDSQGYATPVTIIPGGTTGQESRLLGIRSIHGAHPGDEDAIVLVHDGVRPLIDEKTITDCIKSVRAYGCTATTAPAIETVILTNEDGTVERLEDRDRCRLARAPQGFRTEELWRGYERAEEEGRDFLDSVSLMAGYGHTIYTVEGPAENIKVTTPADYFAFKSFMDMQDLGQLWGGQQ